MDETPPDRLANRPSQVVIRLARMLHASGMPAHELEERMELTSRWLDTPAHFFSTPTSLFVSFERESPSTHLVRVTPPGVNLELSSQLHDLLGRIESEQLDARAINRVLTAIEETPPEYSWPVKIVSYGVASSAAAVFFGGQLPEVVAAGLIGLVACLLVWLTSIHARTRSLSDMTAALVATLIAYAVAWATGNLRTDITILASLIVLIPGLGITVAVNELATQNLASGTARLLGAITTFLTIAFGIVMGRSVAIHLFPAMPPAAGPPLELGILLLAMGFSALAFTVLFQARLTDAAWILLAVLIAFGGTRLGHWLFAPDAAAWTGAFLLGVASNLFGRYRDRPASVMMIPGMLILVPGSIGYFSLSAFMDHDVEHGIEAAFTMTIVAASIVTGLLMANVVVPATRPPKSQP